MISRLTRSKMISPRGWQTATRAGGARAFSAKLKDDLNRLNIPFHPELVYNFSRVIEVVKKEQKNFEKSPYSRIAFSSYLAVDFRL
jgi:hypothetical protein